MTGDLVTELQGLGYELSLDGANLRFRYSRAGEPPEKAAILLEEVRQHKAKVLAYLRLLQTPQAKLEKPILIKSTIQEINQRWEPGTLEWVKRRKLNEWAKLVELERQIDRAALEDNEQELNEILAEYKTLIWGMVKAFKTSKRETGNLFSNLPR